MQNIELINDLERGNSSNNIVIVSEDNLYTIEAVNNVEGSTIITIEPILKNEDNTQRTDGKGNILIGSDGNSGFNVADALDVFGNLDNVNIGG